MDDVMIYGWMSEAERMALRRWAFGLDVLELGCYEGLSTAQLLVTARSVVAVDSFDGKGTPSPRDTRDRFHLNMKATGLYNKLQTWPGEFSEVLPKLKQREQTFDLAFIDGSHDYESVKSDAAGVMPLLRPGGAIVFHDYSDEHQGVTRAVNELMANGWHPHAQAETLVILRKEPKPVRPKIKVALLFPTRDGWSNTGASWATDSRLSQRYNRQVYHRGTSVLTRTFNCLLCDALNDREEHKFTHIAMLHNDVIPQPHWLDVMVEELELNDLDMLSAVVPLKDSRGLTSTGLDVGNPWGVRRLSMKEVYDMPGTFTSKDVSFAEPGQYIVLNSGCWVMRFDQPWVAGLEFRQQDKITFHPPTNKFIAQSISEDWDWSRQLQSRGARLGATRQVGIIHDNAIFHNRSVWGDWETDNDYLDDCKASEISQPAVV